MIPSGVFYMGRQPGEYCGLRLIPNCGSNWGLGAITVGLPSPRVWAWTPPGDLRAAEAYGPRLIADVEYRPVVPASPQSAWTGEELDQGEALAQLLADGGGVTSHGWVPPAFRELFGLFASRGLVGYPQVYDSKRKRDPRKFLRSCVESYRKAGFEEVRPLLGARMGPERLDAAIDEARRMGVVPDFWHRGLLKEQGIACESLSQADMPEMIDPEIPWTPAEPMSPDPGFTPYEEPPTTREGPSPNAPRSRGGWLPLVLAGGAALWWYQNRNRADVDDEEDDDG